MRGFISSRNKKVQSVAGFTLVEVLIVIAIIAVLATLGAVFYYNFQKNARDSRRKAEVRAMRNALEIYFQQNGNYPQLEAQSCRADIAGSGDCDNPSGSTVLFNNPAWTATVGGGTYYFSNRAPVDPLNYAKGTIKFTYYYRGNNAYDSIHGWTKPYTVCAMHYEIGSVTDGDYCMGPLQSQ